MDGDALWRSDKLANVLPPQYRAEYANLIPLALADGTFECNARRVWADVYSYNRPDIDVDTVQKILDEFERVGLLERQQNGKLWGKWTGIDSRLPSESTRERYKQGANELFSSRPNRDEVMPGLVLDRKGIGGEASDPAILQKIFRSEVGKTLSVSAEDRKNYTTACNRYTEDRVREYFREWAGDKRDRAQLSWFLKDLPIMVEGDDMARESDANPEDARFVDAQIALEREEIERRLAEIAEQKKHDAEHAEDIGI